MLQIYGIKNCDTMKRAFTFLDELGVAYDFHDYKKAGLSPELAAEMLAGLGADVLLNKRGTTWRKLDAAAQAKAQDNPAAVMAEHPSLVKRPVLRVGDKWRCGFPKGSEEALKGWLAD